MTTIQDFLDEKHLEGLIHEFIETKHSIQYDKVIQELNDKSDYRIYIYSGGVIDSIRENTCCRYQTIASQQQRYNEIVGLDANLPYNKAFEDDDVNLAYNDNQTSFYKFRTDRDRQWTTFRKNRPLCGFDNTEVWSNEERYEDLL